MTDAKLQRICARANTGTLLLQQLPKTCQWANILRTTVKQLDTAHRVMGLEFCPGAIFTGPEGNGRHTHANALTNNLVEKGGYQTAICIHGSDLNFENSDELYDILDFLERIARASGRTVLLLDQPELSDHSRRFQNQLLRLQQFLLGHSSTLFLIVITRSAADVDPNLLSRFPRYHCPRPNTTAITAFVDEMLKKPVPISMDKVTKPEIINTLKNCSWKQLHDLHTQLLRMIVIHYQLNYKKYREQGLTEEQVYQDGHIKLPAKAVNMVLASVLDQNTLPVMAGQAVPVSYISSGPAVNPILSQGTSSHNDPPLSVVNPDDNDVNPNDPIAQTIWGSSDPVSTFMNMVGSVPEEEEG